MALDVNAWLEEATKRANISADDRKILEGVFTKNAGLQTFVEESGLRQSDYDRNMNKLKTEHAARLQEITEKEAAADRFVAQNGQWYSENNGKFQKAMKDLEDLRVERAQLAERMKGLATRYGVPEEELNIPVSAAPAAAAAAVPAFDEKRFVNREEADASSAAVRSFQAELAIWLTSIAHCSVVSLQESRVFEEGTCRFQPPPATQETPRDLGRRIQSRRQAQRTPGQGR